jgi:hypothetical protein
VCDYARTVTVQRTAEGKSMIQLRRSPAAHRAAGKVSLSSFACAVALSAIVGLVAPPDALAAVCGDGMVEGSEQCDPGGSLYEHGDPAEAACVSGSTCFFQFSCCKFNCNTVGTPGIPCQDGDSCSGPDQCNQDGDCIGGPNAVNGTPCDDGLFCTGAEACTDGICNSSGSPCPETACNNCQEATDSCFDPATAPCSDGSTCVTGGNCDGAGTCVGGVFNAGPCDDGLFCNGTDTCSGGACNLHSGDPCGVPDDDANCAESCNEATDLCNAADPDGSPCEDSLYCNGAADECSAGVCAGTGSAACDDGESCTSDLCVELTDSCSYTTSGDGAACDDGDPCSLDDVCGAGVCAGDPVTLEDLCPWTVVLRDGDKPDTIKSNFLANVEGDICAGNYKLRGGTRIGSDLVSGEGGGESVLRLPPDGVIVDDIVSAGGGAKAFPGSGDLPYVSPAASTLAPGAVQAKSGTTGVYDFSGAHALVGDCVDARASYATTTAALDALTPTQTIPGFKLPGAGTQTITATIAGGLNVVDISSTVKAGTDSVITLDGAGSAATVMVLRIAGSFSISLRSTIELTNGLTAQNVLIQVTGKKCKVGDLALGQGTLVCSPAGVKLGRTVTWLGAIYADGKAMKIGEKSFVNYFPFTGF